MTDLTPTSPARGYTWEPFVAGNTAAVAHSAYSERSISPLAAAIANKTASELPYLNDPSYREAILAWARVSARVELLERFVDEHGQLDETGAVRGAANLLVKLQTTQSNLSARLGLDPLSRAKLGKDIAATGVDLAAFVANERQNAEGTSQ